MISDKNAQQAAIKRYESTLRNERNLMRQVVKFLKQGQVVEAEKSLERYLKQVGEND